MKTEHKTSMVVGIAQLMMQSEKISVKVCVLQ